MKKKSSPTGRAAPCATGYSARFRRSGRQLITAGLFTEFMEQRAPGHTTLDGIIYQKGMLDFKAQIAEHLAALDYLNDPRCGR